MENARDVFLAGATGYLGCALASRLAGRGHRVRALVREESRGRVPEGCEAVIGNALDAATFAAYVRRGDTFVQLVGVPHPNPSKAAQFRSIDLAAALAGIAATILRPWYVLGPGHRWPMAILPLYWVFERIPATRETALRLGLVSLEQMVAALAGAVENPRDGVRVLDVPQIRAAAR